MGRNLILLLAVGLISAAAGITFYRFTFVQPEYVSASAAPATERENTKSVEFNDIVLNDLQGRPRHLNEWQSRILIVNFWAPWCAPCRHEIPALVDLQQLHREQLQIIGLSFDSQQNVSDFNRNVPINYPLLLVQNEATLISRYFGNHSGALPFTAILNQQREIVYQHNGEISKQQLELQIKALL